MSIRVPYDRGVCAVSWFKHGLLQAAVCVLVVLWQLSAAAQTAGGTEVLLLTPTRAESPETWTGIVRGLRQAGLRVSQVAVLPIDPIYAACSQPECAEQAAEVAHMPALLCTFTPSDKTLEIQWFEGEGKHWSARAGLGAGTLSASATDLGERLRRQRSLGERALLRVTSVPPGAAVVLDGGSVEGVTPFEREVNPGRHTLRVVLEGHVATEKTELLRAGALHDVHVVLPRRFGEAVAQPAVRPIDHASPMNFILGAVLGVAAAPLLIASSNAFIDDGQCLASDARGCTERARAGGAQAALLAAGVVALGGAAYLFIAQPLRVELDPRERAIALRWRHGF